MKKMLEPTKLIDLFQHLEPKYFPKDSVIFTKGETGNLMFGVVSGEVELLINEKIVETIKAGDVFGEGALVQPDHLRWTTAKAKTDCQLALVDQEHFLFLVQETPFFAITVMKSLSDRLRTFKDHL
jgi:CRP-like cAMP-binding protein